MLENKTVLITGGSSGIGFELARQLTAKGNCVIICGRSIQKLEEAKKKIPGLHTLPCDISTDKGRQSLFDFVAAHFPFLDVLINNAAIVHKTDFRRDVEMIAKTRLEIETNLFAPIVLSKLFIPLLEKQPPSAIINITTGLVYAPRAVYPVYNATKAALHSFTQVLRHQLRDVPLNILEVQMPVVDTPWHNGETPKIAISPEKAVSEMIRKVEKGKKEIKIGAVRLLYALARMAPAFAFKKINQIS